eukprot:m.202677 g.202677  ORF g.202677 m.202677 type:complete len:483 (-) comp21854_c0_seq1:76-1524(-)
MSGGPPHSGVAAPSPKRVRFDEAAGATYCVCRKSHDDVPMICCDRCNVWYHLECIGLNEQDVQDTTAAFYCETCQSIGEGAAHVSPPPTLIPTTAATRVKQEADTAVMATHSSATGRVAGAAGGDSTTLAAPASLQSAKPSHHPPCASSGCDRPCRPPSRYCSRSCGTIEALRRVDLLLTSDPPPDNTAHATQRADTADLDELAKIDTHCAEVESRLGELEVLRTRLADDVAQAHAATLPPESKAPVKSDTAAMIDCFSCHAEFSLGKGAAGIITHLHKCHLKLESEIDLTQTKPIVVKDCPVKAFCNVFDVSTRSYCARFHAICPKHGPSAEKITIGKEGAGKVCGYPLRMDQAEGTVHAGMCKVEQRYCLAHAGWAKLHSARLDLETVQQCMYREYLGTKRELVQQRMTRRHTVLSRVGHTTTTYTPEESAAISANALQEATKIRAALDAESLTAARASAVKKSNELTGGSLGLPQRHWR